jgi:two-component system response regulator (stage 0 sporulation protein A)
MSIERKLDLLDKKLDLLLKWGMADHPNDRTAAEALLSKIPATPQDAQASLEDLIDQTLKELGIPCALLGHRYVAVALRVLVDKPKLADEITKGLYPTVADIVGTSPARLERAIRHAIEVAWDRGDLDVIMSYFGWTISKHSGRPTNSEFLTQIAHYLRRTLRG